MKYSVKDVRRDYRIWVQREELLEEACCRSNIGYPAQTAEQSALDGAVGGVGGVSGTRVPVRSLDALRAIESDIEDICFVMRRMPEEFIEVLRVDYTGEVEKGKDRRHRESMRRVCDFWNGIVMGMLGRV